MKRVAAICLLVLALTRWGFAQEATPEPRGNGDQENQTGPDVTPFLRNLLQSDLPLVLEADQVDYDHATNTYRASGNVVLRQQDTTLTADTMLLDMANEALICDGAVTLTAPQGRVTADGLRLDLHRQTAIMARALFVVRNEDVTYFIRGKRIEKIGPDRYLIYNGNYTTCDCGAEEADWLVEGEFIDVTFDGYAVVEHGRIFIEGLPVAYMPYGIFPAKVSRSTGFLWPTTGWASDDGYHVGLPFYWNQAPYADATLYADWYENRGTKIGLEQRWEFSRTFEGEVTGNIIEDRLVGMRRWALSNESTFNPYRRLYVRTQANVVSDRDYVVDFPNDINARYDRFLRSDLIVNNLWQHYDLNVTARHFQDLTTDDNSFTWQEYPLVRLDGISRQIGPLPLYWTMQLDATNFYRPQIPDDQRTIDALQGHSHPYTFLTEGRRFTAQPELHAPLNFDQYVTLTPYATGIGDLYQSNERTEDRVVDRVTGETGARAYTRFERVFPFYAPVVRGLKHQLEPWVAYDYRPEVNQDDVPIFDGYDRLAEMSEVTYGLTNRLWMRLFDAAARRFSTIKLTDLRVMHGYDFAEEDRALNPLVPNDERRPWLPIRVEFETLATAGRWLNRILVQSTMEYSTYQDQLTTFNVLGLMGTVDDDALGAEYRYHLDRDGYVDIEFLSGMARYTLQDFITLEYITRYSFVDTYFVEQIYAAELHSLQDCWRLRFQYEEHAIPKRENIAILQVELTGLVQTATSF
jgi:LPS-assembly protein